MKSRKIALKAGGILLKVSILAVIIIVIAKLTSVAYDFGFRIFADEAMDSAPGITVNVAIVEGKSVKEIGTILEEKGLIRDKTLFVFQEKFSEYHGMLQPGVYEMNTAMTPYEMIEMMATSSEDDEEED